MRTFIVFFTNNSHVNIEAEDVAVHTSGETVLFSSTNPERGRQVVAIIPVATLRSIVDTAAQQ